MSKPAYDALEHLAYYAAMQLHSADSVEASYADDPEPPEDLVRAAAVHRAEAEGMRHAVDTLLGLSALPRLKTMIQAGVREEVEQEGQFARDHPGYAEAYERDLETRGWWILGE